jgi:hypothetical protein
VHGGRGLEAKSLRGCSLRIVVDAGQVDYRRITRAYGRPHVLDDPAALPQVNQSSGLKCKSGAVPLRLYYAVGLAHDAMCDALAKGIAEPLTRLPRRRAAGTTQGLSVIENQSFVSSGEGVFIPGFSFLGFDSIPGVILAKHQPKFPTALRGLLAKPLSKQDR